MRISVIVPCYNAEKIIGRCIESLERQDFPRNQFEIILVDDESKDNTVETARKYKGVKVFANKHAGPAKQRNFGAKQAKGDIILFTDSDCVVDKEVLKKVDKAFKENDIAGVGGVYKTLNDDKMIARYVGYEIGYRHARSPKETNFLGTYCCAYDRKIFLEHGGFDEKFHTASGEDPELSFRIADSGHKIVLDKTMFVHHPHVDNLRGFLRQQFWRAYWRVLMYRKHPKKIMGDPYSKDVPIMTVALGMFFLALPFSIINIIALYASLGFLAIFFLVNAGFILFATKKEFKMLFVVPLVIFLRTISWMFGFLYGQIKI